MGMEKPPSMVWYLKQPLLGGVSYLPVQIWQYHRQHKFIAECGATRKLCLPRYAHLPTAAFLYLIPKGSV